MKTAHIVLAASTLVLACLCFAAEDQLTVTKYESSVTRHDRAPDGKTTETTSTPSLYQAADGRIRQEIETKSGRHIVELFGAKPPGEKPRGIYVLDLDNKTYYQDVVSGLHGGQPGERTELSKDLGNKNIQGIACHGYGGSGKKSEYIEIWSCRFPNPPMTFVGEIVERYPDGSGQHFILTTVIPDSKAPAAMFEIPSDFRSVEAPRQNIPPPPGALDLDRGYYFGPIPNPYDVPSYFGPIPNPFDVQVYAGPIPNWHGLGHGGQSVAVSIPLKACGIFEKKGEAYRYVAGEVPTDVWGGKEKRYSEEEIKKITDLGGMVKLLPHDFSQADLEEQKNACEDWYHQQASEYEKKHPIH
jgi:hypothetical protein